MTDDLMTYLHPEAAGGLDLLALIDLPFYDKWTPKTEGAEIHGTLTHRRTETWYGNDTEVLYVATDDGQNVKIVCSSVALARQVIEADPQPGDRVHARFDGQGFSQSSGRTYNKFRFIREDSND
jgi:hypothetical protein